MNKRRPVTKKIRFEVFKRDSFTCQYCGRSAPDVVLHVDHIEPVSKGGKDNVTNFITACRDCNYGKSDRKLSDDSALKKQKNQLDDLQERKNQIELMAKWQKTLIELDEEQVDIVDGILADKTGQTFTYRGRLNIKRLIEEFGLPLVCESLNISIDQYYDETEESMEVVIKKLGGICYFKSRDTDEVLKKSYYIKGILDNRGMRYKYPVVKLAHLGITKLGYESVYQIATQCRDADDFLYQIDAEVS